MAISLEEMLNDWKEDSIISKTQVTIELLKTPTLHAKYLDHYTYFKAKLAAADRKYNTMGWIKRKYFRGQMEQHELQKYGWSQWQGLKPSSAELNQLLDMDKEMNELKEIVAGYKTAVAAAEYILKEVSGRSWILKSLIEYEKFQAGI